MRQFYATLEDLFGGISTAPYIWRSLVLFGSCLKNTIRGSGRSLPDTSYSALLVSTVDTYVCQSSVELLFPYSAQCLVLCGTCSASVTVLVKVVVPVLRNDRDKVRQCRKPRWCRSCSLSKVVASLRAAEATPMVLPVKKTHGETLQLQSATWSMPLLCRSCACPLLCTTEVQTIFRVPRLSGVYLGCH